MARVSADPPARPRVSRSRISTGRRASTWTSRTRESGSLGRANLTWQASDSTMPVRDVVRGLPPGRHQPPRNGAAVQVGFPHQLRTRLEDHLGGQPAGMERRGLPGRLEGFPVLVPRCQRPDRNPQRRAGADPRPGDGPALGGDLQPGDHRRRGVLRLQAHQGLLRRGLSGHRRADYGLPGGQHRGWCGLPRRSAGPHGHAPSRDGPLQGQPDGAVHLRPVGR